MIEQLTTMPKYEVYKDSGVEWLGMIPGHWEPLANKYIFKLKKSQVGKRSHEYELLSLTLNGIIKRDMENPEGKFPAEFDTYQEVCLGDFVFCLFDVEETPRTVGLSSFHGMITGAYTVFELFAWFNKQFFYYFYLNLDSKKMMKPLYKGLRNTIPKDYFFSFKTFVPPLSEQTSIAAFLDRKTAQIDQAVAIKEKQITLLKERKQILIQNSVTRGLNPDAPMRDSGLEWIGEIPAHWDEINKMKYISSLKGRQGWQGLKAEEYIDEGPYVLSSAHFNDYIISWKKCPRVSMERYLMDENIQLQVGDILLMKDGANMGKLAFVDHLPGLACLNSHLLLFRPLRRGETLFYDPKFMFYHMINDGFQDYVKVNGTGATFLGISQESIGNYPICLPPLEEQTTIVAHIEAESVKIDKALSIQQQQIDKLKEYKATLIDSAVTGKIRVPALVESSVPELADSLVA
ncbi:MAG: restriction endonuclease subunit S [Methylobacter sp.]